MTDSEKKVFMKTAWIVMAVLVALNLYSVHIRIVNRAELMGYIKGASLCVPISDIVEPEPKKNPFSGA